MCEVVGVGRMVLHVTKCLEHDCQKFNVRHARPSLRVSVVMSAVHPPARLPLIPCNACASWSCGLLLPRWVTGQTSVPCTSIQ